MEKLKELLVKVTNIDTSVLSNTDLLNLIISISSLAVATLSFAVAMIALVYTGYQFLLKVGTSFCGTYVISSSVWSEQSYISDVIIENRKDKAAAINYVYLRIGGNIYLELVDYSRSPRIVAPFETIKIELNGGVSGYISSAFKVDLDGLLRDNGKTKTLMVATPQGLSRVKGYKRYWDINVESLKNHYITSIKQVRKYYEGKEYGDALQFVVTHTDNKGGCEQYFLYRGGTCSVNGVLVKTDDFSSPIDLQDFIFKVGGLDINLLAVDFVDYNYNGYADYREARVDCVGGFRTYVVGKTATKISSMVFRMKHRLKKFK